jgi:hypothetical protein
MRRPRRDGTVDASSCFSSDNSLRGGLPRIDDRATSLGDYDMPIKMGLEPFKAAITTPPIPAAA